MKKLVAEYPQTIDPDYADLLVQDAKLCRHAGKASLALEAAYSAVAFRRFLCEQQPESHAAGLSLALLENVVCLRAAGKFLAARDAAIEAVEIARTLVARDRGAYLDLLADALTSVGTCYRDLGLYMSALGATEEAVECYRELSAADPARYRNQLAGVLNQQANRLRQTSRGAAGLPVLEEAVAIRREMAAEDPEKYEGALAASLHDLAGYLLLNRKDYERALSVADESIALRHDVLARRGQAPVQDTDLATYLLSRSTALKMLDRYGEALTVVNEAVDVIGNRADSNASVIFVRSMIAKCDLFEMAGDARRALRAADSGLARLRQLPWGTSLRDPQVEAELLKLRDRAARAVKFQRRR